MALSPKFAAAVERRAALARNAHTNAYRLINRAGDGLPDLAVDRYADSLVAHLYTAGRPAKPPIEPLAALAERVGAGSVYLKYRPAQASILSPAERDSLAPTEPLLGVRVAEAAVVENGLKFAIRPGEGLSVGLFLDMREMRGWVRRQAKGKTVLNCFAYTCGFGVAAAAAGAARTVNVDVSRRYLDWGERNYALNGLSVDRPDFIAGDVFDWLKRFGRRGQKFDLVILDPPSYSTTKQTRFSIQNDYARLAALAAPVIAPGGWLVACANTAELSLRAFQTRLRAGLGNYPARIARVFHEPAIDFPVPVGGQPYLKICAVRFG